VAGGAHSAFETAVRLPRPEAYIAAQALDAHGKVLGTSAPVKAS
jgi:hypothetical protein